LPKPKSKELTIAEVKKRIYKEFKEAESSWPKNVKHA